jgi:hypothetical protein
MIPFGARGQNIGDLGHVDWAIELDVAASPDMGDEPG